jgi:hypothetical protein
MHLRGEERLVYKQTSKGCPSSRPGGTPSGRGCHWHALGRPARPSTPSMTVDIKREASRLEKVLRV